MPTIQQLGRGGAKAVYRALWELQSHRTNKPVIETLFSEPAGLESASNSVVYSCDGPVYIEPQWGYIISEAGYIVEESVSPNFSHNKKPFGIATPSPFRFAAGKKRAIMVSTAVSLRHFWEWNYYHFYMDVLGKMDLLNQAGLDPSLPLVLAQYAHDLPFARDLLACPPLSQRHWIVPKNEYVRAERVIFCRTSRPLKNRVSFLLKSLNIPVQYSHEEKRIFLNRSGTRRLTNIEAIQPILDKYSFQIVDAAKMSVEEQIRLFAGTRYLIAIHGAGITNIIFRGQGPLSLLELHHEQLLNLDHKRMCDEMGHHWDHLEGKMAPGHPHHADFAVSPEQLEAKIEALLTS